MVTQCLVRPLLMEWLYQQIFRANLSAKSCLKNSELQLLTDWAMLWQLGFCLGSQWQKMKAFLFHADVRQMYNISFSFHSLLFQSEIIPNTEVFKQKKIFFSYFIRKWNKPWIMCMYLAYLYMHAYVCMFFVRDWTPGSVASNILYYIKVKMLLATLCIT